MANSVTRATSIRLANGGPLDSWEGPYDSIAAACAAIANEVDGDGVNFRLGKKPLIRINGKLTPHWWPKGTYANEDLVEFLDDKASRAELLKQVGERVLSADLYKVGKNKFNASTLVVAKEVALNGNIVDAAASKSIAYISCKPNQVYTYSGIKEGANFLRVRFENAINGYLGMFDPAANGVTSSSTKFSFTTPADCAGFWVNTKQGNIEFYSSIQIEEGATATGYEPYRSQIDSDKVDLSRVVKVAEADVTFPTLKVGKNKLDKSNIIPDKEVTATGAVADKAGVTIVWVDCKPNQVYTYSGIVEVAGFLRVGFRSAFGVNLGVFNPAGQGYTTHFSFTTPADCVGFYINTKQGTQQTPDTLQIEEGSTPTAYEAYKKSISSTFVNENDFLSVSQANVSFARANVPGKNKLDKSKIVANKEVSSNGALVNASGKTAAPVWCKPNQAYTYSGITQAADYLRVRFEDANGLLIGMFNPGSNGVGFYDTKFSFSTPANCVKFWINTKQETTQTPDTLQIEEGGTATDYEPYKETVDPSKIPADKFLTVESARANLVPSNFAGKNKLDKARIRENFEISNTGTIAGKSGGSIVYIPCKELTQYTYSGIMNFSPFARVRFEDGNGKYLGMYNPSGSGVGNSDPITFKTPVGCSGFWVNSKVSGFQDYNTLMIVEGLPATRGKYEPYRTFADPKKITLAEVGKDKMDWWREARLGLFIHYGLYAALEGEFNGVNTEGQTVSFKSKDFGLGAEWIMRQAKIPRSTYRTYVPLLTSSAWDPSAIALMAKNAGMKYVVVTVKHHEGFAMYPSSVTDFNITLTPSSQTLIDDLATAVRAQGLKFGTYYSQNADWYTVGGYDNPNEPAWTAAQHLQYVQNHVIPMLTEIQTRFRPDILWWDIPGANVNNSELAQINAHVQNTFPDTLITNDRLGYSYRGDYSTPEGHFNSDTELDSEICYTMNNTWGWDKNRSWYIPTYMLLGTMIEGASRGGNSLINIGPKPDGSVPAEQVDILSKIGAWMAKCAESITGTTRALYYSNPRWGRITKKGKVLYAHVMTPAVSVVIEGVFSRNITMVKLLNSGKEVDFVQTSANSITVSGLPAMVNDLPNVLKISFENEPFIYDRLEISEGNLYIGALGFRFTGSTGLDKFITKPALSNFTATSKAFTRLFSKVTGNYKILLELSGGYSGDSLYTIKINGAAYSLQIPSTASWDTFVKREMGTIALESNTVYDIEITHTGFDRNLGGLEFVKVV